MKFDHRLELSTCVSFGRAPSGDRSRGREARGSYELYLGRGKLTGDKLPKTFEVGPFSPAEGLLILRSKNSSYVTDDFEVLCVPSSGRKPLSTYGPEAFGG